MQDVLGRAGCTPSGVPVGRLPPHPADPASVPTALHNS